MDGQGWKWALGLIYIVAVALIWIAASFIVQHVEDSGVSPFLITYICNSLFLVYIPMVEIGRCLEDSIGNSWFNRICGNGLDSQQLGHSEEMTLINHGDSNGNANFEPAQMVRDGFHTVSERESGHYGSDLLVGRENSSTMAVIPMVLEGGGEQLDANGRWTRTRVAKISLLICPFWFLAQLTFNISLKYTTVTSNTILSSASSLFTFLVSLAFLGERFTWLKLFSVLLCMGGTVVVSLGDSKMGTDEIASNPLLGDTLALISAGLYAIYISLIRKKIPDEDKGEGKASMAQLLGFLGLFNLLIFLPVFLILNFSKLQPFHRFTWKQLGLIIGKGLLDNVLSDYLWAKASLLTTPTVATAGLTIQVPLAVVVDSLTGHAPHLIDCLGGAAIMFGFVGMNVPSVTCCGTRHEVESNSHSQPC